MTALFRKDKRERAQSSPESVTQVVAKHTNPGKKSASFVGYGKTSWWKTKFCGKKGRDRKLGSGYQRAYRRKQGNERGGYNYVLGRKPWNKGTTDYLGEPCKME